MPVTRNTPFTVTATHDNSPDPTGVSDPATFYNVYLNGTRQTSQEKPAPVQTGTTPNTIVFTFANGLAKGSYNVEVAAMNPDGETKSAPVTLVVTGKPPRAPQNIQIAVI